MATIRAMAQEERAIVNGALAARVPEQRPLPSALLIWNAGPFH